MRLELESAKISARGLSPKKVEEQLADVRVLRLNNDLRSIDAAWRDKDVELERAVIAQQHEIEAQLCAVN